MKKIFNIALFIFSNHVTIFKHDCIYSLLLFSLLDCHHLLIVNYIDGPSYFI